MDTVNKGTWKKAIIGPTEIEDRFGSRYSTFRTDGETLQKEVTRTVYENPYEMPLNEWLAILGTEADGLFAPNVTIKSYDGGEHGGFYDSASSEVIIKGWTEEMTDEQRKMARNHFGI